MAVQKTHSHKNAIFARNYELCDDCDTKKLTHKEFEVSDSWKVDAQDVLLSKISVLLKCSIACFKEGRGLSVRLIFVWVYFFLFMMSSSRSPPISRSRKDSYSSVTSFGGRSFLPKRKGVGDIPKDNSYLPKNPKVPRPILQSEF